MRLAILVSLFLGTCNFNTEVPDDAVARVGSNYLYQSDIANRLESNSVGIDSALITRNYINDWAIHELLLGKSVFNLSEAKQSKLENLVQSYRNDLYIKTYFEELVKRSIDTVVTNQEINEYFDKNRQSFRTNRNLIQSRYVRVRKDNFNLRMIRNRFMRFNEEDKSYLDSIALQFNSFSLNDSIWVQSDQFFQRILPIPVVSYENYLKKSHFFELEDSLEVYLVTVKDVIKRNELAPLAYVRPTVIQIILNKRKLDYMNEFNNDVINEALKDKTFETYD